MPRFTVEKSVTIQAPPDQVFAWSAGAMRAQSKLFRQSKKIKPFEVYENCPEDVPETNLVTTINFPAR